MPLASARPGSITFSNLAAGLIDELRTHVVPVTLGAGERLFAGVPPLQLQIIAIRGASLATHINYRVLQ